MSSLGAAPAFKFAPHPHLQPPIEPRPPETRPAYGGRAGRLAGLVLANSLLGIVTLGFYRFWGNTRLRRYLWSSVSLWGDPLRYTGRGMELFVGFLLALLVLIPVGLGFAALELYTAGLSIGAQIATKAGFYIILFFLFGVAIWRARRYRLTRTLWRQIRAGQTGSSLHYGLMWLGYNLLTMITLGLAAQVKAVRLQRFTMENTRFGDRAFAFDGRAGEMFGKWLLCWVLTIPTLGLSLLWFTAWRIRYFAAHTRFESLRFEAPVTFGNLFWLYIPYIALVTSLFVGLGFLFGDAVLAIEQVQRGTVDPASVGPMMVIPGLSYLALLFIAMPVLAAVMITHRALALVARRLVILGAPDFAAIAQGAAAGPTTGEGLADALDVGGF